MDRLYAVAILMKSIHDGAMDDDGRGGDIVRDLPSVCRYIANTVANRWRRGIKDACAGSALFCIGQEFFPERFGECNASRLATFAESHKD